MRIFVQPQNLLLLNLYPWYKNSQNSIYWKFLPRFIQMLKFSFHIADKLRALSDRTGLNLRTDKEILAECIKSFPGLPGSDQTIYLQVFSYLHPMCLIPEVFRKHVLFESVRSCRNLLSTSDAIRIRKWGAPSQWSPSLYYSMRNLDQIIISIGLEIQKFISKISYKSIFSILACLIHTNDNQLHWFQMTFLKSWTQGQKQASHDYLKERPTVCPTVGTSRDLSGKFGVTLLVLLCMS